MTKKKMGKPDVFQRHHVSYEPEEVVHIKKGEHWLVTWLNRMKRPTQGFLKALEEFWWEHTKNQSYIPEEEAQRLYERQRQRKKPRQLRITNRRFKKRKPESAS